MDETPLHDQPHLDRAPRTIGDDTPKRDGWQPLIEGQGSDQPTPSVRGVVKELLETAIFILLVFLIVRGIIQNFKIEGQSMQPNFHTNQYILVNKIIYFHFDMNTPLRLLPGATAEPRIVYPFHMPQRGDVVVFEYPRDVSKDYIKRVIGLPGETVEIHDGSVFVNGTPLDEPYLEGVMTICRPEDRCSNGPVTVPEGSVFVLGDNRPNSSDSREWDTLPLDRIIGKAWLSYWPFEYWGAIATPTYGQ